MSFKFGVSIDGASKDTYEKSRIGANYEKVTQNFETLNKVFGRENVDVIFIIKKTNYQDVENIKKLYSNNFLSINSDVLDREMEKYNI